MGSIGDGRMVGLDDLCRSFATLCFYDAVILNILPMCFCTLKKDVDCCVSVTFCQQFHANF